MKLKVARTGLMHVVKPGDVMQIDRGARTIAFFRADREVLHFPSYGNKFILRMQPGGWTDLALLLAELSGLGVTEVTSEYGNPDPELVFFRFTAIGSAQK